MLFFSNHNGAEMGEQGVRGWGKYRRIVPIMFVVKHCTFVFDFHLLSLCDKAGFEDFVSKLSCIW